jgi:tRNA threonylcarbamoyladenosine biosynthesis protein TsaB
MTSDQPILALDTSGSYCSVAVRSETGACESLYSKGAGDHFEQLQNLVSRVCELGQVRIGELSSIKVGVGPGSFTGLRIGMSFAKGVSVANRIPLVGVSSLRGIAAIAYHKGYVGSGGLAVIADARRNEVFMATYRADGDGIHEELQPVIVPVARLVEWYQQSPERLVVSSMRNLEIPLLSECRVEPDIALGLLRGADVRDAKYSVEQVASLEPEYLRAVAAKSIQERQGA